MDFLKSILGKRKRDRSHNPDVMEYSSLDEITDSEWNNEVDNHSTRNTKGLELDIKLDWDNWSRYHSILLPKVGIEQTGKRIRVGNAETISWINCERSEFMLINSLTPAVQRMVAGYRTTREKWRKIHKHFSGKNKSRAQASLKKLTTNSRGSQSLVTYISSVEELVRECEVAYGGKSINFEDLGKTMLLTGLDSSFNAVKTVLEGENDETISLRDLGERLKNDEENRSNDNEFAGNLVPGNPDPINCNHRRVKSQCWTCTPSSSPHFHKVCVACKEKGHANAKFRGCKKHTKQENPKVEIEDGMVLMDDIYDPNEDYDYSEIGASLDEVYDQNEDYDYPKISASLESNTDYVSYSFGAFGTNDHILDSGASKTAIQNKALLSNYTEKQTIMRGAGNNQIIAPGVGEHILNKDITLSSVLHVPNVAMNLLSVGQICDLGNTCWFTKTCGTVVNDKTKQIILRAPRLSGGVYVYTSKAEGSLMSLAKSTTHKTTLAHRRLGHLNIPAVMLLGHLSVGLDLDGRPTEGCDSCALAKSHKRVTFARSDSHAECPGLLVHADLGTFPAVVKVMGDYRFWLILVDDYSRYAFVYLLRKKSDAAGCIIKFDQIILNKFKRHIGTIRTDKGKEFLGDLKSYMESNGILPQTTAGYTSSQNGRAERPILTIIETSLTLIFYSGLPMKFIGLAIETAVFLRNKCPHAALPKETPHFRWFGKKPDLSNLRVFGTVCYPHIPHELRHKLEHRASRAYLVGYSDKAKAWKLYNIETGKVIESAHVRFLSEDFNPNTESEHLNNHKLLIAELLPKEYFSRKEDEATLDQLDQIQVQSYDITKDDIIKGQQEGNALNQRKSLEGNALNPRKPKEGKALNPTKYQKGKSLNSTKVSEELANRFKGKTLKIVMKSPETPEEHKGDNSNESRMQLKSLTEMDSIDEKLMFLLMLQDTGESLNLDPTYQEAMAGNNSEEWIKAISEEYDNMLKHDVFKLIKRTSRMKTLKSKLVLKLKETEMMGLFKYKARLVIKGFLQRVGIDYNETYAPVVQMHFLRLMLSYLALLDYEIHTGDITAAFLNAFLKEDINLEIPDGYPLPKNTNPKDYVLKLLKTLYGLKQSPREWNSAIDSLLRKLDFNSLDSENCIYHGVFNGRRCFVVLYVDDIIFGCPDNETMVKLKAAINSVYKMSDKGEISFFLNMHVVRNREERTITLHQMQKVDKLLEELDMKECNPASVPADPNIALSKDYCPPEGEPIDVPYRSVLGKLLYLSLTTRPDISTAVSNCGRFCSNPGIIHWNALLQIVRYLKGTRNYALTLGGGKPELSAYSDANWIGESTEGRSRTGGTVFFGNGPIVWTSKLQVSVSLSTCESELVSLCSTCQDVMECRRIVIELNDLDLLDLNGTLPPTVIYEDNASTIKVTQTEKRHAGMRHIDMKYFYVRERVLETKDVEVKPISTEKMTADIFTKNLGATLFKRHREALQLFPISEAGGMLMFGSGSEH